MPQEETSSGKPLVLVIDDDSDIGEYIAEVARAAGFDSINSTNPDEFKSMDTSAAGIIFVDLVLGSGDGVEILRFLADRGCTAGIALISGYDSRVLHTTEKLATALGLNVLGYLQKPIRLAELEALLGKSRPQRARPAPVPPDRSDGMVNEAQLQDAIARKEFVLHYQPQVDIRSQRVVGAESLVRWQHPEKGLLYPDAFIAVMENSGLIDEMTWQVMDQGMTECHQFKPANNGKTSLSVNVSAYSLTDLELPDKIAAMAERHHIAPECLVIEVTESGLLREFTTALDILARLRIKGIQLSIDDFGNGYSMLQQLRRVPANELKIDRSFVQSMNEKESAAIVRKTIELAHEFGMKVVAEGVETEEQLERLQGFGCDIVQGYLFSKPLPAPEFTNWHRHWREHHGTPPPDEASCG